MKIKQAAINELCEKIIVDTELSQVLAEDIEYIALSVKERIALLSKLAEINQHNIYEIRGSDE